MEQPGVVAGNFALSFSLNFLSIFVQISGSIRAITLIIVSRGEFEDYTLLSHIGRHIVQNPVQGQHHVTTKKLEQ